MPEDGHWPHLWRSMLAGILLATVLAAVGNGPAHAADADDDERSVWNYCLAPQVAAADKPFVLRLSGIFRANGMPGMAAADPRSQTATAEDSNRSGVQHILAGHPAQALQALQDCQSSAVRSADLEVEAACSGNLGIALAMQGRMIPAREQFERALQRYTAWAEALERPTAALANPLQQMLAEARREQARRAAPVGRTLTLLNLGSLAATGGQMQQAERDFQRALAVAMPPPNAPGCLEASANELGRLYLRLGRQQDADAVIGRHAAGRTGGLARSPYMMYLEAGTVALGGTGTPAGNLSATAPPPTLGVQVDTQGSRNEAALQRMQAEAQAAERSGSPPQALDAYARMALLSAAARRPELETAAHMALLRLRAAAGETAAAAYHGKQAVNLLQAVRGGLASAASQRDVQRGYLRDRAPAYASLARLLLDAQRLAEAEQVLQLLHQDEGQLFPAGNRAAAHGQLALRPAEAGAQARFAQASQALQQADDEREQVLAATQIAGIRFSVATAVQLKQVEEIRLRMALDPRPDSPGEVEVDRALREANSAEQAALAKLFLQGMTSAQDAYQLERAEHLLEDAPQFTQVKVTPAQLARLAETVRKLRAKRSASPQPGTAAAESATAAALAQAGAQMGQLIAGRQAARFDPYERLWRADQKMRAAQQAYLREATELPRSLTAAASAEGAVASADGDTTLQLRQRAPKSVVLSYLPGDDRLDILLTTAQGGRTWRLPVGRQTLDRQIAALQAALRDPGANPLPAARALHDQLIAPLGSALDEAGADQLVLSLTGKLRFVPFATLHDGRRWLVERYALALHPGGRLVESLRPASRHWQAAAFGASQGGAGLHALPGVRQELASVVRQAGSPQGAMPGRAWLDRDFSAQALRSALGGGSQVLHIASHFAFKPGDADGSFLLLGDGGTLSLAELGGPTYRFDRTELVTLSACETGLSEADAYGQEVDGLAALLMAQGAPSVLASLWRVEDSSTAQLMASLYRLHEDERQALSRAEALRQAQLALMRSAGPAAAAALATLVSAAPPAVVARQQAAQPAATSGPPPTDGPLRGVVRPGVGTGGAGRALGHAHPFYWAPFVLMGSWL